MAREKKFTQVRKHQRSNPVTPGHHWVRKHPRFVGYRDGLEVRLLQPTHIADVKGVGGKTSTILSQEGYLTLEDAIPLAKNPEEQQRLIAKGVNPRILKHLLTATGEIEVLEKAESRAEIEEKLPIPKPEPTPKPKPKPKPEVIGEEAYPHARSSEVGNIGEDVADSRRHRWWELKGASLEEAERAGVAHKTITKKELLEKLDIEKQIAAGKTAGHIYFHAQVLKSIPAKPEDTPAARKYYVEQIKALEKIFEETDNLTLLMYNLRKHINDMEMKDRHQFHDIMGKRAYNMVSIQVYDNRTVSKHFGEAYRLESIKGTKEKGRVTPGSSTEKDFDRLRTKLASKKGKRKTSKIGAAFKNYTADMLLRHAKDEEKRFKFKDGKDAATQTKANFNLRAVQYGNYVGDKERAVQTQLAYGALHDLASALHMKPEEIGIGGKLAIAIGARGSGRAKAHYEPLRNVINLTATKGNGSLAHEYGHYVDEKLYQASSSSIKGKAGGVSKLHVVHGFMKPNADLKRAINQLNQRIEYSDFKHNAKKHGNYWAKREEVFARAFAAYVSDRTKNPYLVFNTKGDPKKDIYFELYPQGDERQRINESFDKVFKANKGRWNQM